MTFPPVDDNAENAMPAQPSGDTKPRGDAIAMTVVMTVYNAMPYLPAAVDSILQQTLSDFKMVIVNDGSTDKSGDYLDSIRDPRVKIFTQENQGQQAAANFAISKCDTEFVSRMDADDIASEDRLQKQVAFLRDNPNVGMVGGQFEYIGRKRTGRKSELPCDHETIYHELIHNRHAVCNATTAFRTDLFRRLGGYWEHNISEDWDFFLRAAEEMEIANLPDVVLGFRFHPGSINGRRMVESQLHNEYACELARRRNNNQPPIEYDAFSKNHAYNKWPRSWIFRMDCLSVSIYRVAMAEILNGKPISGYARLGLSMACSPHRTLHRVKRILLG